MLAENSSLPSWAAYKCLDLKSIPRPATQHEFGENNLNCLGLTVQCEDKRNYLLGFTRFGVIMLWDLINGIEFKHLLFSLAQVSPCKNSHSGHALKLFVCEVWCKPLEGNQKPWKENADNCLGRDEAFLQRWVSSRGEGRLCPKITMQKTCTHHYPDIVHLRKMFGLICNFFLFIKQAGFSSALNATRSVSVFLEPMLTLPLENTLATFFFGSRGTSKWPQRGVYVQFIFCFLIYFEGRLINTMKNMH